MNKKHSTTHAYTKPLIHARPCKQDGRELYYDKVSTQLKVKNENGYLKKGGG